MSVAYRMRPAYSSAIRGRPQGMNTQDDTPNYIPNKEIMENIPTGPRDRPADEVDAAEEAFACLLLDDAAYEAMRKVIRERHCDYVRAFCDISQSSAEAVIDSVFETVMKVFSERFARIQQL